MLNIHRYRYFLLGVLLILFGIQFRIVDSFVLNERSTQALAKITRSQPTASTDPMSSFVMRVYPAPLTKKITPPRWIGLALVVSGIVICLHSYAVPKP